MTTYKCLKSDFAELEKKINRIGKKLTKNGKTFTFVRLADTIENLPIYEAYGNVMTKVGEMVTDIANYEFDMETLKLGDFHVVSVLEHKDGGNMVYQIDPTIDTPDMYRETASYCEHCNHSRARNKTVVLIDADGCFKQVGTTCIHEYTGINGLDVIKNYADIQELITNDRELYVDSNNRPSGSPYVKTATYLQHSLSAISQEGYVKEGYKCTKVVAFDNALQRDMEDDETVQAQEIINFFTTNTFSDTFLHNIKMMLKEEYCKMSGFVAYAPVAYQKEIAKLAPKTAEKEKKESKFCGKVGEKITTEVTLVNKFGYETQWGYNLIHLFADTNGNVFKWTTTSISLEVGVKLQLTGTVKAHDVYKDVNQTVVTRCKVVEIK